MDSLSNLISILQTNQTHKNSSAIIPFSKFSQAFLEVLCSENLINGYTIQFESKKALGSLKKEKFTTLISKEKINREKDIQNVKKEKQSLVVLGSLSPTWSCSKEHTKQKLNFVIDNENYLWKKKNFLVFLKYEKGIPGFQQCIRISTPGRRVYCSTDYLKKNTKSFHIFFLATSYGIISHRKARALGIGGELLCKFLL